MCCNVKRVVEDVLVWQIPYQMESAGMVGYIAANSTMMLDFQFMMSRRGRGWERLRSLGEVNESEEFASSSFILLYQSLEA